MPGEKNGPLFGKPALPLAQLGGPTGEITVSPGDPDLALCLCSLFREFRRFRRTGKRDLGGHELPRGTKDLAAKVQGSAPRIEGKGTIEGQERVSKLAQPVGGVTHLVPHHTKVGVQLGRFLEILERRAEPTHLDQGRSLECPGKGIPLEPCCSPFRQFQGIVKPALSSKELEVFHPGRLQTGFPRDHLQIRRLRLGSVTIA